MAVDGTDPRVVAGGGARSSRLARARVAGRPSLVRTARRLGGHHTHDPEQYRPEGEKAAWAAESDPIPKLRSRDPGRGPADEAALTEPEAAARTDVRDAAATAAEAPAADPETLEQHVYA